jgi:hypothetical protein
MPGTVPVFSRDGRSLFYLKSESPGTRTELWRTDVASGRSEKALPGVFIVEFDVSDDAKEVLYSVRAPGKPLQLWLGTLDRRSPPQLISRSGDDSPYFGLDGRIVYRSFDGTNYYLSQMNRDGSGRSNVVPYPVGNIISMSPDRHWITTAGSIPAVGGGTFAVPLTGGAPRRGNRRSPIPGKRASFHCTQARCCRRCRLQECGLWTNPSSFPAPTSSTRMEFRPVPTHPSTRT